MRVRDFSISTVNTNQTTSSSSAIKQKYKQLEFKYLYFRIQSLINKRVTLSLRYEQLRSPETHAALVKPISEQIVSLLNNKSIARKLNKVVTYIPVHQTPRFDPYDATSKVQNDYSDISTCLIFILFLLKYEYIVQSENNLILYELLTTKANFCELLAIRMLKVYKNFDRINMLFETPLLNEYFEQDQRYSFNTLELSVLSKSKHFLSQPIIIRILDMFYNGELILRTNKNDVYDSKESEELIGELHDFENYNFNKITIKKVIHRSNIVPKYQSLVLNLKVIGFMCLYFTLILSPKNMAPTYFNRAVEIFFWIMGFNFTAEFFIKIANLEFVFFKKMIWNHMDGILILLINISFILKFFQPDYYRDAFSLIAIILLPRSLVIFNNYQFFNLITLSLKKMVWNLMGLCCLFFALISGFYFSFITLSKNASNLDVMFDMVKVFFGFTPSVWNNWDNYNTLGKIIQMSYLFLIQFIIGSMLAIVLSGVFSKINQNNHEEFNYIKTVNIIIHFKASSNFENCYRRASGSKFVSGLYALNLLVLRVLVKILNIFKIPIVLAIFVYEKLVSSFYLNKKTEDLKFFTIFDKDKDYYQDKELVTLNKGNTQPTNNFRQPSIFTPSNDFAMLDLGCDDLDYDDVFGDEDDNDDVSVLHMKTNPKAKQGRRYSHLDSSIRRVTKQSRLFAQISRNNLRAHPKSSESLKPSSLISQSHLFSHMKKQQPLQKSLEKVETNNSEHPRSDSTVIELNKRRKNDVILERLNKIEELLSNMSNMSHMSFPFPVAYTGRSPSLEFKSDTELENQAKGETTGEDDALIDSEYDEY